MRQQIEVEKLATPDEFNEMADWMVRISHRNAIDPAIFQYPSLATLKASRGDVNTLYMPVQTCYVYESLAINPDNSAADTAESLKAMFAVLHFEAVSSGYGESYFLCSDQETCKFAEHQGMEKVSPEIEKLIQAAKAVLSSAVDVPLEHAQALGELDIALNEYQNKPGMNVYRRRHRRAKVKQAEAQAAKAETVTA